MNGAQHQRRRFSIPNVSDNAPAKSVLEAQCATSGHIPAGPAKHRQCHRCGAPIPVPSLEEVSRLMAEASAK